MRINRDRLSQSSLFDEVSLPQCKFFREEAENIVALLLRIPPFDYSSSGEFQKRLIIEYWLYFDNLESVFTKYPTLSRRVVFKDWFMKATPPENIRRACQWLCETEPKGGGIIVLKQAVIDRAQARAETIREGI